MIAFLLKFHYSIEHLCPYFFSACTPFFISLFISMDFITEIVDSRSRLIAGKWGLIWGIVWEGKRRNIEGRAWISQEMRPGMFAGHIQMLWKVLQCYQSCNGLFLCSVCSDLNRAWPSCSLFLDLEWKLCVIPLKPGYWKKQKKNKTKSRCSQMNY